ncbi:MAG TPA: glycosyltransferase [Chloroflexota bacterium]|nr:glycosyltransferase [Chloroflexota bacterium]
MKVSLYVPCYNGAAWIRECVESLLAQRRPADEVAVIDDGSIDGSAMIVRSFGSRVRLITHESNHGLAVARNTALTKLPCDVLASVDADVRASPDWLGELLTGFHSSRVAAVGGMLLEANQARLSDRWRATHMAQHAGDLPLRNPPVLPGANVAVRRDVVRAIGGYDESFRTNYEDADLQHRLLEVGYQCTYVPAARAHHLRTDTASSVLRTYWNWLRPPRERSGEFATPAALIAGRASLATRARRLMWSDHGNNQSDLCYLTLLIAVLFPLADTHYAASQAAQRGDLSAEVSFLKMAETWSEAVPAAIAARSPAIAANITDDLSRLAWWPPAQSNVMSPAVLNDEVDRSVEMIPAAWWKRVERARDAVAREEGWPTKPLAIAPETASKWTSLIKHVRTRVPDALAVIVHGLALQRSEKAWGDPDVLCVTHVQTDRPSREIGTIAAHRIGWLPPSTLQQSLLATGVLVWGEPAALEAVPSWRPEQIDPLESLAEMARAEMLLTSRPKVAAYVASGALLIARRGYTPWLCDLQGVLGTLWPESPPLDAVPAADYVKCARDLLRTWLFHWDASRLSDKAELHARTLIAASA